MAAAAKCNISFQIYYTSSIPTTGATALFEYRIKNSADSHIQYNITSVPVSGGLINVPNFPASGEYEYKLRLTANGVSANQTGSFVVRECSPPPCETPKIDKVYLGEKDQILMEYSTDPQNLYAVEYQIATDSKFTNIIHVRVIMGSDYKPTEYIEMNDGTIVNKTTYFIRVRRHCSSSVVSPWSDVVEFQSGDWRNFLESFWLASGDDLSLDICNGLEKYAWKANVTLSTPEPKVGSLIYLLDGMLAIRENIRNFGQGVPIKFMDNGIGWIRFSDVTPSIVYIVDPKTAQILNIESKLECPTP